MYFPLLAQGSTPNLKLFLSLICACFWSSQVFSDEREAKDYRDSEIQAPEKVWKTAEFEARPMNDQFELNIPRECLARHFFPNRRCIGSSEIDHHLEEYYWHLIEQQDSEGMKRWVRITNQYLFNTPKNPNKGRLKMLGIFGNLHAYSIKPVVINLWQSPYILGAFKSAEEAKELLPRSPNMWAFYWAIRNFTEFALGMQDQGLQSAQKMLELEKQYGKDGIAGPVGAVAHLMGYANKEVVALGIDLYEQCFARDVCNGQTSIAPFQIIGTRITQAEAYGFLGNYDKMHEMLDIAETLAEKEKWPFAADIKEIRDDLTNPFGLIEEWNEADQNQGIRTPLGAGHRTSACAYCHVGNQVPKWYHIEHN